MGNQDFISEATAAHISGVSSVTLNRFADAGYLIVEKSDDGISLFSRSEIEKLFNLTPAVVTKEVILHSDTPAKAVQPAVETVAPAEAEEAQETHSPLPTPDLHLEREVARLSSIVQLQEKYIELKEQQLKDLSEERNWLRGRIEKLEEKSDRDQLILVSVSESNRGLIKALETRKSTVQSVLEWVGLLPPPPPSNTQS